MRLAKHVRETGELWYARQMSRHRIDRDFTVGQSRWVGLLDGGVVDRMGKDVGNGVNTLNSGCCMRACFDHEQFKRNATALAILAV